MLSALTTLADTTPRHHQRSFWHVMRVAAKVGLVCHVVFIGLFLSLGMPGMVAANVGSVLLYGGVMVLLQQRHSVAAIRLLLVEVLLHAVAAVRLVGWDSGFQSYLAILLPLVFVSTTRNRWIKVALGFGVVAVYLALDAYMHRHAPTYTASAITLDLLRWFNTATMLGLLGFLAHRFLAKVQDAEARLHAMASTDPLTGVLNRRSLLACGSLWADSGTASVLMGDIDHFKRINDAHGHDGGDEVLVRASRAIQAAVRPGDLVGRWGGEEFVVLLPGADTWAAAAVAERIRVALLSMAVARGERGIAVSITIGVATRHDGETIEGCIARADGALYDGKAEGRNRVVCAS